VAVAVSDAVAVKVQGAVLGEAEAELVADAVGEAETDEEAVAVAEAVPGTEHVFGTTATPRSSCLRPVLEYARVHCTITARSSGLVLINSAVRVTAYSTRLAPSSATLSTLRSAAV